MKCSYCGQVITEDMAHIELIAIGQAYHFPECFMAAGRKAKAKKVKMSTGKVK